MHTVKHLSRPFTTRQMINAFSNDSYLGFSWALNGKQPVPTHENSPVHGIFFFFSLNFHGKSTDHLSSSDYKTNHIICTSNSMGSSEIWDKYHECCIGNGDKFHEAKPSEIYHFQYNKSGIYPKFHCYPCYSQLIPYSMHMRMPCISVAMYTICHYVLNMCQH